MTKNSYTFPKKMRPIFRLANNSWVVGKHYEGYGFFTGFQIISNEIVKTFFITPSGKTTEKIIDLKAGRGLAEILNDLP